MEKGRRISIHALREEGDPPHIHPVGAGSFLSTPSARRATDPRVLLQRARTISIHALREGATKSWVATDAIESISIHALREEGDQTPKEQVDMVISISIHALREEGDLKLPSLPSLVANFYPRPPREGDRDATTIANGMRNFYPRPPRGGRQILGGWYNPDMEFLSTPSARAT